VHVDILDRSEGRYSCELGEFTSFPAILGEDQAPPRIAAFSRWGDAPGRRRSVDGRDFVDVDHQGRTWTYELEPAWTTTGTPSGGGFFQTPEMFDIGIMPD